MRAGSRKNLKVNLVTAPVASSAAVEIKLLCEAPSELRLGSRFSVGVAESF